MLELTVTGHATGHYEPDALADALHRVADAIADRRDPRGMRERVRGTVPGVDVDGTRVATDYDVTFSVR